MFGGKYNKAVTFSFDDGITQDKRMIDILDKYGLKCVLTHVKPPIKLYNDPQKCCEEHSVFGCDYIGLGGMPRLWNFDEFTNDEVVDKFIEMMNEYFESICKQ